MIALGLYRLLIQHSTSIDTSILDIIAWALLPILAAALIVWSWRLLHPAAGVLSWVILISALAFMLTRLIGLTP